MSRRTDRVADELQALVAELLLREIKDPRIGLVTVTNVKISPDLRHARVYFSTLGDEQKRTQSLRGLISAAGFIRSQVARRLQLARRARDPLRVRRQPRTGRARRALAQGRAAGRFRVLARTRRFSLMHGILLIDKPDGITSAEVVRRVKRQVKVQGRPPRHAGSVRDRPAAALSRRSRPRSRSSSTPPTNATRGLISSSARADQYSGDRTGATVRTGHCAGSFARRSRRAGPALFRRASADAADVFGGEARRSASLPPGAPRSGGRAHGAAGTLSTTWSSSRSGRPCACAFGASAVAKGTSIRVLAEDIGDALSFRGTSGVSCAAPPSVASASPIVRRRWTRGTPAGRAGLGHPAPSRSRTCRPVALDDRVAEAARQGKTWVSGAAIGPRSGRGRGARRRPRRGSWPSSYRASGIHGPTAASFCRRSAFT